jgi:copper chaperone
VQSFTVTGMTCDHCVRAVTSAIQQIDPAARVEVDLRAGRVAVRDSRAADGDIVRAIEGEGYTAQPLAS